MSMFIRLVLYVVAASLSCIHVAETQALHEFLQPFITACSEDHSITDADIQAARDSGSPANIPACFIGCVFKKAGFLNEQGDYDLNTGLQNLRQYVRDDEQYNNLAYVATQCSSVEDEPVNDGTAGCERGGLLVGCFMQHRTSIIL